MTLDQFIKQTLVEISAPQEKTDGIKTKIIDEAKKRKTGNCAAISDDEVRKMIIKFANENKDTEQTQLKSISAVEEEKARKCEQEQKNYQTSLW